MTGKDRSPTAMTLDTNTETADIPSVPGSLEARLKRVYGELPGSERAFADIILEFPGDIVVYSATDLAERAQVSKAAVSRLMKRLGYADYREAQKEVRDAQANGQPLYLNSSMVLPPTEGGSIQRHLEREVMNLRGTLEALDQDQVATAVEAILKARRVWTLGFRNSYSFAAYLRRQLIYARPDVTLLPIPGQIVTEDLGAAGPEDLVIIIGLRRRLKLLSRAMEMLHRRGVPTLYITDHRAVATTKLATWTFPCQVRGLSLFDSYVGVISLLNFLSTEVVALAGEAGRQRMKAVESAVYDVEEMEVGG